jgi:putative integral membrane protein (TIGR02587 family)
MNNTATSRSCRSIPQSLREYARGIAGGLLFSLPLLYTMEVWWAGFIAQSWHLFVYVLVTFVVLLGYNRYAGLRQDAGIAEVAIDSIEEMGIGLLLSALVLWLLGRITLDMGVSEIVGKIVIEAMTVAIGVSVGTAQLGSEGEDQNDAGMGEGEAPEEEAPSFFSQIVMAFCGAILIAGNVGPTEEILVIGSEVSSLRLLGIAAVSVMLGGLILFFSSFAGSRTSVRHENPIDVMAGVVMTYMVALAVSALILLFFGRFNGATPVVALAYIVVLGLPATLGASAGRLLLQGGNSS